MKQKLIINLYVPINTILTCNDSWRQSLNLPKVNQNDFKIINELRKSSVLPCINGNLQNQKQVLLDSNLCIRKVKSLSFYEYLLERFLRQARESAEAGIRNFIIQNSNAPFFDKREPVIYWIMRVLTSELKLICTDEFKIGLKLNGELDDWSIDIACRNKIDFIYLKKYSADLLLQKKQFNHDIFIYHQFDENNLCINKDGFIIDQEKIKKNINYIKNIYNFREYLSHLSFYPANIKAPILIDLWEQKNINFYKDLVDYIICNSCLSYNGYADCGLDINKILSI